MHLLAVLAAVLSTGNAFAQSGPETPGDLTLTEFMAEPNLVPDYYGEWFEIRNNTGDRLLLTGMTISSSGDAGIVISGAEYVDPGGYFVFGVNGDPTRNGNIPVDYVYNYNDFEIALTGDTITLTSAEGVRIDEVTWNSAEWQVERNTAYQANLNAHDLEWANDLPQNWCISDAFISGSGLKGTPGVANEWCDNSNRDSDGDGLTPTEGDCDDQDAYVQTDAIDGSDGATYGNANDDADCDGVRDDGDTDDDGDGYAEVSGDCNDADQDIMPTGRGWEGSTSAMADGKDNDCNCFIDDVDYDNDGFSDYANSNQAIYPDDVDAVYAASPGCKDPRELDPPVATDCENHVATINPEATETPYDAVDQDCNGFDECDMDGDSYDADPDVVCPGGACCPGGNDCDDANETVHPNAPEEDPDRGESADGVDDDCNGIIDDYFQDYDGDGYTALEGDCDDDNPSVNPAPDTRELCTDLLDNDCDGLLNEGCSNPAVYGTVQGGGCGALPRSAGGVSLLALLASLIFTLRQRRTA